MNSAEHDISQGGNRNIAQTGADSVNISSDVGGTVETHHHHAAPQPSYSVLHQLRAPVGDFVGREAEIAQLLDFYEQQLAIVCEIGDQRGEVIALWNLALAWEKLGDRTEAVACAEASLTIQEEIEYPFAPQARAQLTEWRG